MKVSGGTSDKWWWRQTADECLSRFLASITVPSGEWGAQDSNRIFGISGILEEILLYLYSKQPTIDRVLKVADYLAVESNSKTTLIYRMDIIASQFHHVALLLVIEYTLILDFLLHSFIEQEKITHTYTGARRYKKYEFDFERVKKKKIYSTFFFCF